MNQHISANAQRMQSNPPSAQPVPVKGPVKGPVAVPSEAPRNYDDGSAWRAKWGNRAAERRSINGGDY